MTRDRRPTADDAEAAQRRIADIVVRSPVAPSQALTSRIGSDVSLKLETVQPTGSFKVRGAASKILALEPAVRNRGVVTASTGNHGRAVAHVGAMDGTPVAVCVSENVPAGKIDALRASGCEVVIAGGSQTEDLHGASEIAAQRRATVVHPFDDPDVIAGQATIGLEIADQVPQVTDVVVPLSGGGLISGIAIAVADRLPGARIIGVSMTEGAVMVASISAGHPVEIAETPTLADSLQGGIGVDNRFTLPIVRDLVDELVRVDEQEIWDAMVWAWHEEGVLVEGAGAVGIAALLSGRITVSGPTVVVCSGANIEGRDAAAVRRGDGHPPARTG